MNTWFVDISLMVLIGVLSLSSIGAKAASLNQNPPWRLTEYLDQVELDPKLLMNKAASLFSAESIQKSKTNPEYAYAWQDRLAMLTALSQLFDPDHESAGKPFWNQAGKIIEQALHADPSLLVRDAAVESMRRINRMRPGYLSHWKSSLEKAFISQQNQSGGEGYFIRETILSAMREGNLRPSVRISNLARGDTNPRVRAHLEDWNTATF